MAKIVIIDGEHSDPQHASVILVAAAEESGSRAPFMVSTSTNPSFCQRFVDAFRRIGFVVSQSYHIDCQNQSDYDVARKLETKVAQFSQAHELVVVVTTTMTAAVFLFSLMQVSTNRFTRGSVTVYNTSTGKLDPPPRV